MRRAGDELQFSCRPGRAERPGEPDALGRRHQVVRGPVHEQDRRRGGARVGHRAGLPGQVGYRGGRRAEQQRLAGLGSAVGNAAGVGHVGRQAGQVGDREPRDHCVYRGAGQGGQQRQVTAGRVAPQEYAAGVKTVPAGVLPGPADRGAHVVQRCREAGLAAEPVVDRRHREALRGQPVVEIRAQHGQRVAA